MNAIKVYSEWQDTFFASANRLRIVDGKTIYTYRQHGITKISRAPMHRVEIELHDGPWFGVASCSELAMAGLDAESMGQPHH
jgi:hypothetical protein